MRRGEPPRDAVSVVLRTGDLDVDTLARDAEANFDIYGFYGLSVWVTGPDITLADLLAGKLKGAIEVAQFRAGDLYARSLHLWDTGQYPHYDVVHDDGATLDALVSAMRLAPFTAVTNPYYEPDGG
jgi:hypothetical protein